MTRQPIASNLLLMSPDDNCLIARMLLAAGTLVVIDGVSVALPHSVSLGYKVARCALVPGDKVLRYGAIIGTVTMATPLGALIHTHNLESDYLPTCTLSQDGEHFSGSEKQGNTEGTTE